MRKEFRLTPEQRQKLLDACKPTPVMFLSGGQPMFDTPQQNANRAWKELGAELGFVWDSCQPSPGKSDEYFTAEVIDEAAEKQNLSATSASL